MTFDVGDAVTYTTHAHVIHIFGDGETIGIATNRGPIVVRADELQPRNRTDDYNHEFFGVNE